MTEVAPEGPCSPYATIADVEACPCAGLEIGTEGEPGPDRAAVEAALAAASLRVWRALGGRYPGVCQVTIWPCPPVDACGAPPGTLYPLAPWTPAIITTGPEPQLANVRCGCETHPRCGCVAWPRVELPWLPVLSVEEVTIDGVALDPEAWHVAGTAVERTDGQGWPACQAPGGYPDGEGSWSITYTYGGPPFPADGIGPLVAYACELAKRCRGDACALDPSVRVVSRDGVEYEIVEPADYREQGLLGYGPLDDWIAHMRGGVDRTVEAPRLYRPPVLEVWPWSG